jgi:hypothetical protein
MLSNFFHEIYSTPWGQGMYGLAEQIEVTLILVGAAVASVFVPTALGVELYIWAKGKFSGK